MSDAAAIPDYGELMNPLLEALRDLGGSGTIEEVNVRVFELLRLNDAMLSVPHPRGRTSEIEYRLAWARTYLKAYEVITNSSRGVWSLTAKGREIQSVDPRAVKRVFNAKQRAQRVDLPEAIQDATDEAIEVRWRRELRETLASIPPAAFERLAQRLLRESGFIKVEVTGRSGDGGIDGTGVLRLGGLLSFRVIFQCKRWQGSVEANTIREFQGAMAGRADKGLILTTSTFTRDAIREASRDGAPTVDLVDGEQLLDMLKSLSLGVTIEQVESIKVNRAWFADI